jgi:hypothetical protein
MKRAQRIKQADRAKRRKALPNLVKGARVDVYRAETVRRIEDKLLALGLAGVDLLAVTGLSLTELRRRKYRRDASSRQIVATPYGHSLADWLGEDILVDARPALAVYVPPSEVQAEPDGAVVKIPDQVTTKADSPRGVLDFASVLKQAEVKRRDQAERADQAAAKRRQEFEEMTAHLNRRGKSSDSGSG